MPRLNKLFDSLQKMPPRRNTRTNTQNEETNNNNNNNQDETNQNMNPGPIDPIIAQIL